MPFIITYFEVELIFWELIQMPFKEALQNRDWYFFKRLYGVTEPSTLIVTPGCYYKTNMAYFSINSNKI